MSGASVKTPFSMPSKICMLIGDKPPLQVTTSNCYGCIPRLLKNSDPSISVLSNCRYQQIRRRNPRAFGHSAHQALHVGIVLPRFQVHHGIGGDLLVHHIRPNFCCRRKNELKETSFPSKIRAYDLFHQHIVTYAFTFLYHLFH